MNPYLKKFKILTTWIADDRVENLLEGTLYLKEAFKFIELLLALDENEFEYELVSGFKGKTHFKEEQNMFKDIIVEVSEQGLRNVVEFFNNSVKYNEIFNVQELNETNLKIQLKD